MSFLKTNTLIIIVIAVIIAAAGGLGVVSNLQSNSAQTQGQSEVLASNYITYSPTAFADAKKEGKTILFFWAPWCGTCSFLDDELRKRSSELPKDLTILRTNYDVETELKNKYAITSQHTLVQVDKDGNEIKKWIGGGVDLLKEQIR